MFYFTVGDLLKSDAKALVNTVNCEGYMGKGIAYQFKLQFPENNADYIRACRDGSLRIGKLHIYEEKGKTIVNFPTKDKWREKSKLEFIEAGLDELRSFIIGANIVSIAIPPLGSGNGGLIWSEVKLVIEDKLSDIAENADIFIFEPSRNYASKATAEPELGVSALALMEMKERLNKFTKLRLQKTAYFTNIFSDRKYFRFQKHTFGPYDHSIDIISRSIREFQSFHNIDSVNEVKKILLNRIISQSVVRKSSEMLLPIEKACTFVNSVNNDHELECLSTICFLVEEYGCVSDEQINHGFETWSADKAKRFGENEIKAGIDRLLKAGIIVEGLLGYTVNILRF